MIKIAYKHSEADFVKGSIQMCMKDLATTPKKSYSIVGEGKLPSHQPPSLITCGGEENWP